MDSRLVVAAALLLGACSPDGGDMAILGAPTAADVKPATGPGTRYYDGNPPPRFVKEGMAVIILVSPEKIAALCGTVPPPGLNLVACVRRTKEGAPVIIGPHPALFPNEQFARIILHEGAHAWGQWPGDHPS